MTLITKKQLTDGQIRYFALGAEASPSQVKRMAQELEERRKADAGFSATGIQVNEGE